MSLFKKRWKKLTNAFVEHVCKEVCSFMKTYLLGLLNAEPRNRAANIRSVCLVLMMEDVSQLVTSPDIQATCTIPHWVTSLSEKIGSIGFSCYIHDSSWWLRPSDILFCPAPHMTCTALVISLWSAWNHFFLKIDFWEKMHYSWDDQWGFQYVCNSMHEVTCNLSAGSSVYLSFPTLLFFRVF